MITEIHKFAKTIKTFADITDIENNSFMIESREYRYSDDVPSKEDLTEVLRVARLIMKEFPSQKYHVYFDNIDEWAIIVFRIKE